MYNAKFDKAFDEHARDLNKPEGFMEAFMMSRNNMRGTLNSCGIRPKCAGKSYVNPVKSLRKSFQVCSLTSLFLHFFSVSSNLS